MSKTAKIALVGARHGAWTVIAGIHSRPICRCDCGTERSVAGSDLRSGKSLSCGCVISEATTAAGVRKRTHGLADSPTMTSWTEMKRRCYSAHRKDFPRYGGRGIAVCAEWRESFTAFLRDMGQRPAGHTLDRRDNDGPYDADNCRWSRRVTQERNKRSNARYAFLGENMTVTEAAERHGIKAATLFNRINTLGWEPDRAVTTPVR